MLDVCNVYRITPNITNRDRYAKRPTGNISEKFLVLFFLVGFFLCSLFSLANETERSIKAHAVQQKTTKTWTAKLKTSPNKYKDIHTNQLQQRIQQTRNAIFFECRFLMLLFKDQSRSLTKRKKKRRRNGEKKNDKNKNWNENVMDNW